MATQTQDHEATENLFDSIHAGQQTAVELAENVTDSVGDTLPELWNKPLVEGIPPVSKVTAAAFGLVHGIIDAQNEFTQRIVSEVTKGLGIQSESDDTAAKTPAKTPTKRTRAAAKKA